MSSSSVIVLNAAEASGASPFVAEGIYAPLSLTFTAPGAVAFPAAGTPTSVGATSTPAG